MCEPAYLVRYLIGYGELGPQLPMYSGAQNLVCPFSFLLRRLLGVTSSPFVINHGAH